MLCGKHDRFDENNKRRKDLLKKTRTDNEKERYKSASQEREKEIWNEVWRIRERDILQTKNH